jgi:hypothetical protein
MALDWPHCYRRPCGYHPHRKLAVASAALGAEESLLKQKGRADLKQREAHDRRTVCRCCWLLLAPRAYKGDLAEGIPIQLLALAHTCEAGFASCGCRTPPLGRAPAGAASPLSASTAARHLTNMTLASPSREMMLAVTSPPCRCTRRCIRDEPSCNPRISSSSTNSGNAGLRSWI